METPSPCIVRRLLERGAEVTRSARVERWVMGCVESFLTMNLFETEGVPSAGFGSRGSISDVERFYEGGVGGKISEHVQKIRQFSTYVKIN